MYLSIPFPLAIATSIRIGHLLGSQRIQDAILCTRISIFIGVITSGLCGYLVYLLSDSLGYFLSPDEDVRYRINLLAPLVAGFQVAYSIQCCCSGVLRSIGRQSELVR